MDSTNKEIIYKKSLKLDNVIKVPTSLNDFFKYWFEFLTPFHQLTNREISVISTIAKHRYELTKVVTDSKLINKILFSIESRDAIIKECNINQQHYKVILSKLRKSKVIIDDGINPKLIPHIKSDKNTFQLLLSFEIEDINSNTDNIQEENE